MSLAHGRSISAEDVESIISRKFSPQKFASLCNALTWASSRKRCTSLPSFTERVNVKDGGIDAEWYVELEDDNYSSPFLGYGWNVFQYKQRDIFTSGRDKVFSDLKAGLQGKDKRKGAVCDLYHRTGKRPNKYILFTNLDLTHKTNAKGGAKAQKGEIRKKILEGYDQPDTVNVEIVDAAGLASLLNDLPHLRSSFFSTDSFATWEKAWSDLKNVKFYGANTILVGRDKELEDLRTVIDNHEIRAVVISGQHNIGKTRLVLEATNQRPIETIIALDPRSMNLRDLLALESSNLEIIVVIEDPDLDKVENFINQALASQQLKLVITLPTVENSSIPIFGLDKRINHIQIQPLSEDNSRELLRTAKANFDYSVESWVIKQAGGNPGILLQAANFRANFRKETDNFITKITDTLKLKIRQQFGENAVEVLQLLSLLTYVGIKEQYFDEIKLICQWFGENIQPNKVVKVIEHLEKAGVIQVRGFYVEVIPPLFANSLAEDLLKDNHSELLAVFQNLSQDGRSRLLQRLAQLKLEKISWFWDELFSSNGLLSDLQTALSNGQILRVAASAVPNKVAKLLKGLETLTFEQRKSIRYSEKDALVWSIEELIFRKETSRSGICYLKLLAETEGENYGNTSVTSKFCQCFQPLHSQVPLSLRRRLEFFKTIITPESPVESRLLGINVIKTILYRWGYTFLREESGNKPIDIMPDMTWGEVWKYREELLELLMGLAQSEEPKVADAAREALPNVVAEFALLQFSPEFTVTKFKTLVDWAINNQVTLSISKLADALESVYSLRRKDKEKEEASEDISAQIELFLAQIKDLINQLDKADFAVRLKRWGGQWTNSHKNHELDRNGKEVYRDEKEAQSLVEEVIKNPKLLTAELLEWLCSREAQEAHNFCLCLGQLDSKRKWLPKIEEIGTKDNGTRVFSAYFGGLAKVDRSFISERLDQLTKANNVKGEAIVGATKHIDGDSAGVERVEKLIQEKRVNPIYVEQVLSTGRWFHALSCDNYLRLLKAIAGVELENAAAVIDFFFMWLYDQQFIEGELAEFVWQSLEASNTLQVEYKCDQIACKLALSNIERGFTLLEKLLDKLLTLPYDNRCWNPINRYGQREFWKVLYQADSKRAVHIVLYSGVAEISWSSILTNHISAVVNQETDLDLLIEFALENEKQAELVCSILYAAKFTFWSIAFKILEKYPENLEIKDMLSQIALDNYWWGNVLEKLENHREKVEQLLDDPATPSAVFGWLEELLASVNTQIETERNRNTDRL
ncbi:hypothetical protein NIES4073_66480 [Kalymmatonema gypsitolerans NIES-4073]|nr:hypothetical protein NIES4073_66480 [Scytonema sp. NIES-4073]